MHAIDRTTLAPSARERRIAARVVDMVLVFAGAMLLFGAANALQYHSLDCVLPRVAGCAEQDRDGLTGNVALGLALLAFASPLLYEVAFRRTPGKRLMGVDILQGDAAARGPVRFKRAVILWTPLLVFNILAAVREGESAGALLAWLPGLYTVYLALAVLLGRTPLHDRLSGTTVARTEPGALSALSHRHA
jgi:uncharacterized RDD family membrane protein YckC